MIISYFKKLNYLIFTWVFYGILHFGVLQAQEIDLKTVVARVNGEVITLAHLMADVANLPPEYLNYSDEYLYKNLLEQLVNKLLLAQMITIEDFSTKTLIQNNIRSIQASQYSNSILKSIPSYEDVRTLYEKKMGIYSPEKEYSASHILLATEDEAENIIERVNEGENFATLASEFSIGPSASDGGSLGWFRIGQLVPEFEAAVLSLELGMVSRPIKTEFGWHIIKLDGERLQASPSFDELKAKLEMELKQEFLQKTLESLRDLADISYFNTGIDKAIIKNTNLLLEK